MALLPPQTIAAQTGDGDYRNPEMVAFLNALAPNCPTHLFAGIEELDVHNNRIAHKRAEVTQAIINQLAATNYNGAGIFVTVNEMNSNQGNSRSNDGCSMYRAIFADDDAKRTADAYPLPPSAIIETSPGKKQVYWFLEPDRSIPRHEYERVMQGIVNSYGGDAGARDIARVLRLPGFYNRKPAYDNPITKLLELNANRYTWKQILDSFPQADVVNSAGVSKVKTSEEAVENMRGLVRAFVSGENYHEAEISIIATFTNTRNPDVLKGLLYGLMEAGCDYRDARFNARWNAIPTNVDWFIKQRAIEAEQQKNTFVALPEYGEDDKYTRLPVPGGGLYKIMQWVLSTMTFPNETIAIATAEHLVSVFGGGHYHINNNNTSRKRVLLGESGVGKSTIGDCVQLVIEELLKNQGSGPICSYAENFAGSDSFSFSVQHQAMEQHRIRSFVVPEAGEAGSSKAGDTASKSSYQLQALSRKINKPLVPPKYSEMGDKKEKQQLQTVYGGVWCYVHESTPASYAKVLSDARAFESGDMSRADVFFIDPIYRSADPHHGTGAMPQDLVKMFGNMANDMAGLGNTAFSGTTRNLEIWESVDTSQIDDEIANLGKLIVTARNEAYTSGDKMRIALTVRKYERILISLLVCALADAAMGDKMQRPVVTKQHWEYALKRDQAIVAGILANAGSGGMLSDDLLEDCTVMFMDKFKSLIASGRLKAQRYLKILKDPVSGDDKWQMNFSGFNAIMQNGVYKTFIKDVHRGDKSRARAILIGHLLDLEVILPVTVQVGPNEFKAEKNRWWLNNITFPVK